MLASTSQACYLAHFAWLAQLKVFKYCVLFCILFIIQWWPKLLEHLAYLKRFQLFCWIGHYITHKTNYCRNYLRWKESAGTLKMMDWPSTPSSKFGESWKINWTDQLYIQRKTFGLSCRYFRCSNNFGHHCIFLYILIWSPYLIPVKYLIIFRSISTSIQSFSHLL